MGMHSLDIMTREISSWTEYSSADSQSLYEVIHSYCREWRSCRPASDLLGPGFDVKSDQTPECPARRLLLA